MSDLKIQGVVEMSSEGAERAFARVGQTAEQMAQKVAQTASQAGQAVDQIGTNATDSADSFTRAEGKIVASIKRATTQLQMLGKTASERIELNIDTKGLDRGKFEPLLADLRELEAAQVRAARTGSHFSGGLQNTAYQMQDFIMQVNGGTAAMTALGMQLPQLLGGFGAFGAAAGVVAALLPSLAALLSDTGKEAKTLEDALSGMDGAVSQVGRTVATFDMEGLYEQFNTSSAAARAATVEQIKFQLALLETQRLTAQKAFGASLAGIGAYGFMDKMSGGGSAAERVAEDLGVTLDVAQRLAPVLDGLRKGTEDVGGAFTEFGRQLLSGNKSSVELAMSMQTLANGEKDAYAASSALSEALERMAKGHVTTKKESDAAADASAKYAKAAAKAAEDGRDLADSLLGQSAGLSSDFLAKWDKLAAAYAAGGLSLETLTAAQAALLEQQPAMKQAAKDAEDYGKALALTVGVLESRALAMEQELETYRLTKSQIEQTTIARLEEVRAMAAAGGATADYLRNLDREIEARRRIAEAAGSLEARKANDEAAKRAAADWQRTANKIEDALVDALMKGGKSGSEYIEGLFRTMVLRPVVQAIVQPVAGSITSAMGFGPTGQGGAGGGFSAAGSLANSAVGMFGGAAGTVSALSSLAAGTSLGSFGAGMASGIASFGSIGSTAATFSAGGGVGGAVGAGMQIGAAMPYVAAALFAAKLLGAFDKKPSDKSSWATYDNAGNAVTDIGSMTGKKDPGQEQRDATAALTAEIGRFAELAGITSDLTAMIGQRDGIRLKIEDGWSTPQAGMANGGDPLMLNYGSDLAAAFERMLDDVVDEGTLPAETIDAWRALKTDAQGAARDADELISTLNLLVAGYDTAAIERANLLQAEGEALDAAMGRVLQIEQALSATALPGDALAQSTAAMARAFESLGMAAPPSAEAFNQIVTGLDLTTEAGRSTYQVLMGLAPAYLETEAAHESLYNQLLTDEERRAVQLYDLSQAFEQLGVQIPDSVAGLRSLIDAQDTSTAAGLELRAQLLGLVPASIQVAEAFGQVEEAVEAIGRSAADIADERSALEQTLLQLQGNTAELRRREIDALDESNRGLQEQIWALEDAAEAAAATAQATRDATAAAQDAFDLAHAGWKSALGDAEAKLLRAYQEESSELAETARRMRDFAASIRDLREDLLIERAASPGDRYEITRARFSDIAGRAQAGDADALQSLTATTQAYLEASRIRAQSAAEYALDVARAQNTLTGAESAAEVGATTAEQQLTALKEQVSALIDLGDGMLSVEAAINNLKTSIEVALEQQTAAFGNLLSAKFPDLDANGDLKVSLEEFKTVYDGAESIETLEKIFTALDKDGSGALSLLEAIKGSAAATPAAIAALGSVLAALSSGQIDSAAAGKAITEIATTPGVTEGAVEKNQWTSVKTPSGAQDVWVDSGGAVAVGGQGGSAVIYGKTGGSITEAAATQWVSELNAAGRYEDIYKEATGFGVSSSSLDLMMGWAPGTSAAWAAANGKAAFATGSAFTNGIVTRPTAFDLGLMGEAGPEAIMPLANIGGSLGVRAQMPGQGELIAEVRALRAEIAQMKAAAAATARNTHAMSRQIERWDGDGLPETREALTA